MVVVSFGQMRWFVGSKKSTRPKRPLTPKVAKLLAQGLNEWGYHAHEQRYFVWAASRSEAAKYISKFLGGEKVPLAKLEATSMDWLRSGMYSSGRGQVDVES